MAVVSFTIPNDKVAEFADAFCDLYKYDETKLEGESRNDFARRQLIQFVKDTHRHWRIEKARTSAEATEQANPDITIT